MGRGTFMVKKGFLFIVLVSSSFVLSANLKESLKEREIFFDKLFKDLEVYYQHFKKNYVKKHGINPKKLPPHFPDSIRVSIKRRSIERLKRMAKDQKNATNDLDLYLGDYFNSLLKGERRLFYGDLVKGQIIPRKGPRKLDASQRP
jgi:hypothetical protein